MSGLTVRQTPIEGLLVFDIPLHGDARGWFKENWQRAKMLELGLPDFGPVQNNMSFNAAAGSTRGLHAEPWDKMISLANGRIFGAWVDLRPGDGFGTVFTLELGPETAVFVPRGVANGYQALAPDTVYSYLVNEHWSPDARGSYTYLNLADETVAIDWPIPLSQAEISAADAAHPRLADVTPMAPKRTVVVGCKGQLGRALTALLPGSLGLDLPEFDLRDPAAIASVPWGQVGTIINAAAYTSVDAAETHEGRRACWDVNVACLSRLVEVARQHRIPLVHVSTDYVFDGTAETHTEHEAFSPLGVYGQTKAAGDALVATLPRHWIVRTSWVIGDGNNFVRTMANLADKGVKPSVVGDQYGRLTFTTDLAAGIVHLISTNAPGGTYNLTNTGPTQSWADIAKRVFELRGRSADDVTEVTTAEYFADKPGMAPRPTHSTLALSKLAEAGFEPANADDRLREYLG
ncbi:sugar nucleotide-binding protein [Micropruina glycogenica]|uniref:dTDP-4-dehydrorhamnose reductase n=1 Tax=Micropruina glycogenica TaxID=75385 RepID=A0A2N9JC23_9ACTN|nr:bifunctional dTDP-4-dehydrorhamnose 3,5-epimerase family protein/NAD(P)-dependent oxidoreductase [Micropruina glycogenica]SPD85090.1 dTDP-4-dehydrorhamnose 3,5-epimerase / dTDP-4-dehydrorhamnose reductase [Micropruina glycogenica]